MPDAAKKPKKDSFAVRMKKRGREFANLGQILAHEPKQFPAALLRLVRKSSRAIWDLRGGGLYACGYLVTFVWLEITTFIGEIVEAESIAAFFGAQIFEMIFRFLGESLKNMVVAFMWPVFVVSFAPPWGAIALGLAFASFDRLFRKRIEKWLFHDAATADSQEPASPDVRDKS